MGYFSWLKLTGLWAVSALLLIALEIGITMADFVVEDDARKAIGGVFPGERVSHGLMAVIYGAALSRLVPLLFKQAFLPTSLAVSVAQLPTWLLALYPCFAAGVTFSGLRDLYAAYGGPYSSFPWSPSTGQVEPAPGRK